MVLQRGGHLLQADAPSHEGPDRAVRHQLGEGGVDLAAARDHRTFSSAQGLTVNYGELEMIEFDGSNPRTIGTRQAGAPLLLSDNDKWLYTFTTTGGKVNLVRYTMTAQ